jgi:hypothetical protein
MLFTAARGWSGETLNFSDHYRISEIGVDSRFIESVAVRH